MVCLNPKPAYFTWQNTIIKKTGKARLSKRLHFKKATDEVTTATDMIPCGKCEGCKIDKANDWATRCYLESQNHAENAFLTLTYNKDNLPKGKTLLKEDLQKFWKRLRKTLAPTKICYLACGEYGLLTKRPHYHAAVFNYWPKDATPYKKNEIGDMLYTSKELEKIWGKGFVIIGNLTYESACYIARYVHKKAYGIEKEVKKGKTPEFITSSKRPAIAKDFYFEPYKWLKIIRNNGVIVPSKNGIKLKPIPMYLRQKWKENATRDYYLWTEIHKKQQVENQNEILKGTTKNLGWYRRQTNETTKERLKRLDKSRQQL